MFYEGFNLVYHNKGGRSGGEGETFPPYAGNGSKDSNWWLLL
jgi:hypothetical protein